MSFKSFLATALIIVGAISIEANASTVVAATGGGWCAGFGCDNTQTNQFTNNDIQQTINNWTAFTLGTYGPVSKATLSIYESSIYGSFYSAGHGDINFYIGSGLSYAGLMNGPSIGTIVDNTPETVGQYIDILLNNYGLQQINLLEGTSFIIGGSNGGSAVDAFGYSNPQTPLPYLTLDSAAVSVPEPAPLALLGLGLVGFIAARRKSAK